MINVIFFHSHTESTTEGVQHHAMPSRAQAPEQEELRKVFTLLNEVHSTVFIFYLLLLFICSACLDVCAAHGGMISSLMSPWASVSALKRPLWVPDKKVLRSWNRTLEDSRRGENWFSYIMHLDLCMIIDSCTQTKHVYYLKSHACTPHNFMFWLTPPSFLFALFEEELEHPAAVIEAKRNHLGATSDFYRLCVIKGQDCLHVLPRGVNGCVGLAQLSRQARHLRKHRMSVSRKTNISLQHRNPVPPSHESVFPENQLLSYWMTLVTWLSIHFISLLVTVMMLWCRS